jgi:beta-glucanase (GH16 family)
MRSWLLAALTAVLCLPATGMAEWQLEHEEDFAHAGVLDASYWSLETGYVRNHEDQYYSDRNATVGGGVLRLEAREESVPNAQWKAGSGDWRLKPRRSRYTSASLVARRPLQYGRVEVVARTPSGAGLWPAIWLLHEGQGVYGEIDLFEAVGKHRDTVFAGVHYGRTPRTRQHRNDSRVVPGFEGSWHTHTLEWTPDAIRISLDGQPWFDVDPGLATLPDGGDPLRQPMRLRINLALGGSWGGPIDTGMLPGRMDIASVRVWRWVPETAHAPSGQGATAAALAPAAEGETAPVRWGR